MPWLDSGKVLRSDNCCDVVGVGMGRGFWENAQEEGGSAKGWKPMRKSAWRPWQDLQSVSWGGKRRLVKWPPVRRAAALCKGLDVSLWKAFEGLSQGCEVPWFVFFKSHSHGWVEGKLTCKGQILYMKQLQLSEWRMMGPERGGNTVGGKTWGALRQRGQQEAEKKPPAVYLKL